jgi:hypothetical protein
MITFKPLFAKLELAAKKLYTSLCANVANNSPVVLYVPECNPRAITLAHRHQLQPIIENARMYKRSVGDVRIEDTYRIITFELG